MSQPERQYTFTHYTPDNGLTAYETITVVQDEVGYMWIGTANGLQRFDGTRFITFYHKDGDASSIPENKIIQLLRDKNNNLWVLTTSGRIGIFNTRSFKFKEVFVKPANVHSLQANKKIFTDSRGNVFVVCFKSELLVYDEKSNDFLPVNSLIPLPEKWPVISFCEEAKTGKYYIGTDSGLVVYNVRTHKLSYRGNNTENEFVINQMAGIPSVAPMLIDSKHRLWILSWPPADPGARLFCFDLYRNVTVLKEYSFYPIVKAYHEPHAMIEQKNGTIWVRGRNLFASYLENEGKFQLVHNGYVNDQSIYFEMVHDLQEDREQNIWVATKNNGLYRFNPSKEYFLNVHYLNRTKNIRGDEPVLSFAPDNNGTLLIGSWQNGIYRYDSSFNNIAVNIKGINENNAISIWAMQWSRDTRTMWMGVQPGGLYSYDSKSKSITYYDVPAVQHSTIRQIVEDKKGNLWLGTQNRGLFKCTKKQTGYDFKTNVKQIPLSDANSIYALCIDLTGKLWVATKTNGVYVIDTENEQIIDHFTAGGAAQQRLPTDIATAVCVYNDTTIIIGAGGISIYNPRTGRIKQIRLPSNLANDVAAIQKDYNGDVWVSQSTGIFRFNPLVDETFIVFGRTDGIANDRFIIGASAALPDGRLVFGCTNQFIAFDPRKIDLTDSLSDVIITGFKVNNQYLPVDSLLKLKFVELTSDQNAITIDLSELEYMSSSSIKYKLEGIDKDWFFANYFLKQVSYSWLPAGTYRFMAQSEDSKGKLGKNITILTIKIKPHFWQTWWFWGLTVFAGLGIFLWVDKLRVKRIKASERVRTRIAQSLTEDMSHSLTSINIISELAKTKFDNDTKRVYEYINQISDTSNRTMQAMNDMVWSINPKNDSLKHTVDRLKTYVAEIESECSAEIYFEEAVQFNDLRLSMEARYEILNIFKEAIKNAVQHAQAKYIEVSISYHYPVISFCVKDDGKGFNVKAGEMSRGICEMRRRASIIKANLLMQSDVNTGTTIQLDIGSKR
jgi:ligand-binding sensor domain-containing protein/two-component sensor histidine kinase